MSWNSDRTLQRGYHVASVSALAIIGYIFLLATENVGVRYAGAVLVACGIYPIIPLVSSFFLKVYYYINKRNFFFV